MDETRRPRGLGDAAETEVGSELDNTRNAVAVVVARRKVDMLGKERSRAYGAA